MCNFFSALVKYKGDGEIELLHKLGTPEHSDSHSDLILRFNLRNDDAAAKVEYRPDATEPTGYRFILDEEREPSWWNTDIRFKVIDELEGALQRFARLSSIDKKGNGNLVSRTGDVVPVVNGRIEGYAYLRGYTGDLSALTSIGGYAYLGGYTGDLSALTSIGGDAYLGGYTGDLSALTSIGGYADLRGYTGDLSALTSIGGYADLRGYTGDLSALRKVNSKPWKGSKSKARP